METNHKQNYNDRYADILHLPHHTSNKHPHMSKKNRAAQFAPFAALTGFNALLTETARQTDEYVKVDEDTETQINIRLQFLAEHAEETPSVSITYFRPDEKKDGGSYIAVSGNVKQIDLYANLVILTNGTKIPIHAIHAIEVVESTTSFPEDRTC